MSHATSIGSSSPSSWRPCTRLRNESLFHRHGHNRAFVTMSQNEALLLRKRSVELYDSESARQEVLKSPALGSQHSATPWFA